MASNESTENIKNIAGPKYSTVEADRKILEEDSVADAIMYRKDEYPAYED